LVNNTSPVATYRAIDVVVGRDMLSPAKGFVKNPMTLNMIAEAMNPQAKNSLFMMAVSYLIL
jgi:hypothetical protein